MKNFLARVWRFFIGPKWSYSDDCYERTDPKTGRVQIWDESGGDGWSNGDWVEKNQLYAE